MVPYLLLLPMIQNKLKNHVDVRQSKNNIYRGKQYVCFSIFTFICYLGKLMIEENSIEKRMKGPMLSLFLKGLLTALNLSMAIITIQTIDRVIVMFLVG